MYSHRYRVRLTLNMKKYRLLFLIFVLYKCGVLYAKSNEIQSYSSVKFAYPNVCDYRKARSERGIKESDLNINPNDLIEKVRVTRGVSGSKNHLRLGDAHQIANYFLTGGPLKGHDHFRRASDCDSNNTDSNVVGMSNPKNENNTDSSLNEQNPSTNGSDPIIGAVHLPLLPSLPPPPKPIVQPPNLHKPPILHPSLSTLIPKPHVPVQHTFLGSILHPRLHPHLSALHSIPSTLVKAASMPVHGLLQAQSHLHDIFQPHGLSGSPNLLGSTNKTSKRAKAKKHSANNFVYLMGQSPLIEASLSTYDHKAAQSNETASHFPVHPEPSGYIVRYVPHNKDSGSSSSVNTPQPSDAVDNDSNPEENATISANDKNQDADENK